MHTLSPALPLSDRKEALEFVFDSRHLDILKESLSPGLEVSVKEMHHYLPHTSRIRPHNDIFLVFFYLPSAFLYLFQGKV